MIYMNRIFKALSLASMLLIAVQPSAQGQNIYSEGSSEEKESATVLDKVQYRVTYAARLVEDTTKVDSIGGYDYSDDDMRLDMGKTVSEFYSGRKAIVDKWMKEKMDRGERDFTNMPAQSSISWIVYRNYPEGETTTFDDAMMNSYRISEKTRHHNGASAQTPAQSSAITVRKLKPTSRGAIGLCGTPKIFLSIMVHGN